MDLQIVKENCKNVNNRSFGSEDGHYDLLSALQKSIRGSDPNAALYYLGLLAQSNDVQSICRRLLVIGYEDIGLANPAAVDRTFNAIQTARLVGFPEAAIPLGFAVVDLALSPKSKSNQLSILPSAKRHTLKRKISTHTRQSFDECNCFHTPKVFSSSAEA